MFKTLFLFLLFLLSGVSLKAQNPQYRSVVTGAERTDQYLHILENRNVAVVANHTSIIGETHLVDSLITLGINVVKVFTPEHGFRGVADAGERISVETDERTGVSLVSLYGNRLKPSVEDLAGVDIVIFDIQDVGARFYTYISTMHYVMEACAENGIPFLILDRPNPNGYYVDGPVLDMQYKSFVGMHPVPVVHGMTVAEYAKMINGEGWLEDGLKVELHYVLSENYDHNTLYRLPVNPSPNLRTQLSIYLYPSLCLFEGTAMSVGRGTDFPFMVFGHPRFRNATFTFTPQSVTGASNPPFKGEVVQAVDLREFQERFVIDRRELYVEWLIHAYNSMPRDIDFFNSYFTRLVGNEQLQNMIESGAGAGAIMATWQNDVNEFKKIRTKYLLYKDFE